MAKPVEGSAAEEAAETPAFEKREDTNSEKLTQADRIKLAAQGEARPDGSYPIRNTADLENATKDWVRTDRSLAVKSWIEKRAKQLGAEIPAALTAGKPAADEVSVAKSHMAARGGN